MGNELQVNRNARMWVFRTVAAIFSILFGISGSFFFFPSIINIFRVFYPTTEKYTFFSSVYGTYTKIDHINSHEKNFNKFKIIETMEGKELSQLIKDL